MVSIIENRSMVTGIIRSVSKEPDARSFMELSLELQSSQDHEGFPNLAKADEGREIIIKVRKDFLDQAGIHTGDEIKIPVRKAFGQIYFLQE